MEFLRQALTTYTAGTRSRSLLKQLVYKKADMAHADPSAPATHVCWPLMLELSPWAGLRHAAMYETPAKV